MERLPVKMIGISNVTAEQVQTLLKLAEKRPSVVQNRCFAQVGWDRDVREICKREGIAYQGFSILTANLRELSHPRVRAIAAAHKATVPQIVFAFARRIGMMILTGTTDAQHMREDLASVEIELADDEIAVFGG